MAASCDRRLTISKDVVSSDTSCCTCAHELRFWVKFDEDPLNMALLRARCNEAFRSVLVSTSMHLGIFL